MLPENLKEKGVFELHPNLPINERGREKVVYPVVLKNGVLCAAKIYRPRDRSDDEIIDCVKESRAEYNSYTLTHKYPALRQYIPMPIQIICDDKNQNIGLLVEWRNGEVLRRGYSHVFIPSRILDNFEQVLLGLPKALWLHDDSLSELNVCWNPIREDLWLAEPKLTRYKTVDIWKSRIKSNINYLRKEYTKAT